MKKYLFSSILILLLSNNVKAFPNCYSSFTYSINSFGPPVVDFIDHSWDSLGTVTSYAWDFGDGQTSTAASPTHTYAANGVYGVCLVINTSTGCSNSYCTNVNAVPPTPAVAAQLYPDSTIPFSCTAPAGINFTFQAQFTVFTAPDSALYHIFFGDGLDSTYYLVISQPYMGGSFTHQYMNSGTYNPSIIITAPGGVADTFASPQVLIASTCGNISGKVYSDNNNNCVFDAGDSPIMYITVYLISNSVVMNSALTNTTGDYSFNVPAGQTYDIEISQAYGYGNHQFISCPAGGSYSVTTVPSTGNDFALSCLPAYDIEVFISASCLRPGFTDRVYISADNMRCNTPTGQIDVIFPPDLTPLPDSANSYIINGNTVTIPISSPANYWWRTIPVLVNSSAAIGTTECIDITATSTGDANPSNNSATLCQQLVGAFDPNQKSVVPVGVGPQGAIDLGTDLTYTIDFQNTGNYEAVNVFILDTLSSNLDITSLKIIGASHPMTWAILAGGILKVSFDNIMLPDSNSNEFASHGYVAYKIAQAPNLPQSSVINNTAGIYFDFNQPVITNTTINTIDLSLGLTSPGKNNSPFNISPNPASNIFTLTFGNKNEKIIDIYDYSGRRIEYRKFTGDSYRINSEKFESGLYLIKVLNQDNSFNIEKLIIQK